jgi:hypothetical protein
MLGHTLIGIDNSMVGKNPTELAAVLLEIVFFYCNVYRYWFSTAINRFAEADAECKRQSKIRTTFITDYCYVPFWDLYCLWLRYFLNR